MGQTRDRVQRPNWGEDDSATPILHVDMDAFFASVELIDRPELRGKPVIVGGSGRGVVLAATYEARAFGVHSAMPINQAKALAPTAVFLTPHREKYVRVSRKVMDLLHTITPVVEKLSIDEAFLDVSGARRRLGAPTAVARLIRQRVSQEIGVVASVGIASTKFVAKLASGYAKPDGLMLVPHERTVEFLHSLPVSALWGVGQKTEWRLQQAGISSVTDLAHTPMPRLVQLLGSAHAHRLYDLAWGRDSREVEVEQEEKSIGHEQTFVENLKDRSDLNNVLLTQSHQCAARLRALGLMGGVVAIKVRFGDFTMVNRSITLGNPTDVALDIYRAAKALCDSIRIPQVGVRLLGVRLERLGPVETMAIQPTLDDADTDYRGAEQAMDAVQARFGAKILRAGSLIQPPATEKRRRGIS